MELINSICQIIAEVLEKNIDELDENTDSHSVDNWDSLAHLQIIIALETEFGLKFRTAEINELKSVKKIAERIQELTKS